MEYKHSMKVVARRTGLSPHLIRMWERRYGAVKPDRSPTGRRLYSEEDIERLILLRQATLIGESISTVAGLTRAELAKLVAASTNDNQIDREPTAPDTGSADYYLKLCIEAIRNLDSSNLESRLLSASVALGQNVFLEEVLRPLLVKTGDMWNDGTFKVAHEHLASAVIRSLLGSMAVTTRTDENSPLLLATTPAGQRHEFGALMASVTAASLGWRTMYLGPTMPAEDIAGAALQSQAGAVLLSLIYPADDPHLPGELRKLSRLLANRCRLLVGGRAASAYEPVLREIDAITSTDLADLREKLTRLRLEIGVQKTG